MKIGLVGSTYDQRSLPFDAQRMVNLFALFDKEGKEVSSLLGTAGLETFVDTGAGEVRGCFSSSKGRAFFVAGSVLYEVDSNGTTTNRGSLSTSSGNITIDENTIQLVIVDGSKGYTFTYSTDTFANITDPDFPSAGTVTFIDGYIIVNQNDSGRFYISAVNNAQSWNALDFANAESSPDGLLRVLNGFGQLFLFGDTTTEIWTNTGDTSFPFQRISGAKMDVGILAPYTAQTLNSSVVWVGKDKFGSGTVYTATGFSPKRISTDPIERRIAEATSPSDMVSWVYQEEGHLFYVLTGGGLETSLVYDFSTQLWHERAYLNQFGSFEPHLGNCHMFAFGKNLVGSRVSGKVFDQSLDYFDDAGEALARERVYTHLSDEDTRIRFNKLEIGLETGVGVQSGQGSTPLVSMQLSKDGARTWSNWYTASIGAVGKYLTKVAFRRLGVAEQMTFKIRITDPVKVAITGSYLK